MRVLVYEFVTGGGFHSVPNAPLPTGNLLREGTAMVQALVDDWQLLAKELPIELCVPRDHRLANCLSLPNCHVTDIIDSHSLTNILRQRFDVAIVVAPETDRCLSQSCRLVRTNTRLLLNAPDALIRWASSKHETSQRLALHGIPCPVGFRLCNSEQNAPNAAVFPIVVKPDDGAGSQEMSVVSDQAEWITFLASGKAGGRAFRVEQQVTGRSASIAALCGRNTVHWLEPCWQHLDAATFEYEGSSLIAIEAYSSRVRTLANKVAPLLRDAVGYIGVDVILGAASDGSDDFVIEINPRLTTSYVTVRQASQLNLVEMLWKIATEPP